jgi:spore coat protein A
VFAGLAGMYLLRDTTEDLLTLRGVLPAVPFQTELVVQDRWFTDDGQLFMETTSDPDDGIEASIDCDFMMVNGAPWPVMDVEPRKYRFRMVNGSDSRFYVLQLDSGGAILVVGTDLSLLPAAVEVERLVIAPGERYDLVLDFTGMAGATVTVLNNSTDGAFRGFGTGTGPGAVVTNRPTDPALGRRPTRTPPAS